MTFDTREISNYDGIPIMLYEFRLGSNFWRFASDERDVVAPASAFANNLLTVAPATYKGVSISDSGIVQSGDTQNDDFTVTLPANEPFTNLYLGTPPSDTVLLVCRRTHRGEGEAPVVWVGEVRSTKRVSRVEFQVICKPLTATLNRNGLRLAWSRSCPHALYDRNCKVKPADYGIALQVERTTGTRIVLSGLSALPAGYLAGGYFEFTSLPGVTERRAIESQSASFLSVLGTTDGIADGSWITVFPGCNRLPSTCKNKFNNLSNYGGYPHMPGKSPFDGDPVF